jgi:hypothetical protein
MKSRNEQGDRFHETMVRIHLILNENQNAQEVKKNIVNGKKSSTDLKKKEDTIKDQKKSVHKAPLLIDRFTPEGSSPFMTKCFLSYRTRRQFLYECLFPMPR